MAVRHIAWHIDTKRSLRAGVRQDTSRLTEDYRKIGHLIPTGPEARRKRPAGAWCDAVGVDDSVSARRFRLIDVPQIGDGDQYNCTSASCNVCT